MKNDEQIKLEVLEYIFTTPLPDEVTGIVKRDRRPRGSEAEDVIISILANENGQIQDATVNVNIYVKDKPAGNQTDPDHDRFTVCQIEDVKNADKLKQTGIDYVALDEGRILSVLTANQNK